MPARAPQFAKLTRPRLHNAVPRERLFTQLDEARDCEPATCVVGPPGAGKTTLVASWLDERDIDGIWYQIDPGDADLATFFYYLGEAAKPYRRKNQAPLPLLRPEYLQDVDGFSRRFFRELFSRLTDGATLVLDNYQEVEASHRFHEIVASAVNEIPPQRTLLAITRHDPPDCYARLIANGNVDFVEWDDLRLTLNETREIVGARLSGLEASEVDKLHEDCDGWAAGLTLMLDRYSVVDGQPQPVAERRRLPPDHGSTFGYFAAQVFERLPEGTRKFLLATSVLPQVPVSVARELTGDPSAGEILEDLYKRHLFTHRRAGAEPVYWYHALFREFLQAKSLTQNDATHIRDTVRRAARLLEARSDFDNAFKLFFEAQDWLAARRLVERHAEALLAQGRGAVLRDWILVLPESMVERAPWLRFWLGTSLIQLDQREAISNLERAFGQFAADGDAMAQALCAAGVIDSYFFDWSEFHSMRRWLGTLETLLDRLSFASTEGAERRIYTSLLLAMLYVAPEHRLLPEVVARVTEMFDEEMDVNSKMSMAMNLLAYCAFASDIERAGTVLARANPLADHPELTPFNLFWWNLRLSVYHPLIGQYERGMEALDHALNIRERHGLNRAGCSLVRIVSYRTNIYALRGDVHGARKCCERVGELANPSNPMESWHVAESRVMVESIAGNYIAVLGYCADAAEMATKAGNKYIQILAIAIEATGLVVLGELEKFQRCLNCLRVTTRGTCFDFMECAARFLETYAAFEHGDRERGRSMLIDALQFARVRGFSYPHISRYSPVTGYLFAEALRERVEVAYVTDVIRRLQIRPPIEAPESWPWPIRIYTLGRFEVGRDGEKLEFSGRAPRKVLALLKEIVAGGEEPVSASQLMDALWPDEEGDAARKSLDVSLVRLRKLLGSTDSVVVRDEHVSLNPEICWVDAWTFSRLGEHAEYNHGDPKRLGARALELYRGAFLPGEDESRQMVVTRLKLRDKLARLISELGRLYEDEQAFEKALDCYRHGIEADELAEEFYQGVMRCHAAMGRPAEGMAAYRRLRQTLSVVLGVKPSQSSEQLKQLLGNAGSQQQ